MVEIAADVFGTDEDEFGYGLANETILVSGAFEPVAGVAALQRAAERFIRVDETGFEHPTWEAMVSAGDEFYTPNYVSDPEIRPSGIEVYVDCKGEIAQPMRDRFVRILEEELADLERAQVRAAVYTTD
jgi:hypothetical protein